MTDMYSCYNWLLKISRPAMFTLMLLAVVSFGGCGREDQDSNGQPADNGVPKEGLLPGNDPEGPQIMFPKSVRTEDKTVNTFIYEFLSKLALTDYKGYRLMVTHRREPASIERFNQVYGRVEKLSVSSIERIDDPDKLKGTEAQDYPLPVYSVKAHVILRDNNPRDIEVMIFREQGRWVSSH